MRSRLLFLLLFGCLLFWGAAAFYAQDASVTTEQASQSRDPHLAKQAPRAARAIEAGNAGQLGERLKPQEKICDAPRWSTFSAEAREWQAQVASGVASDAGVAAPSLIGIVVLLI